MAFLDETGLTRLWNKISSNFVNISTASNFVDTSTNQTIGGIKEFTGKFVFNPSSEVGTVGTIRIRNDELTKGTWPSTGKWIGISLLDGIGTDVMADGRFGLLETLVATNRVTTYIRAYANDTATSNANAILSATVYNDGTKTATCTETVDASNEHASNSDIITRGYLNGNITILGNKTFTNTITMQSTSGMKRDGTNSYLHFHGGTSLTDGATLALDGQEHGSTAGYFTLRAKDTTNQLDLVGTPSGALNWGGNLNLLQDKAYAVGTANPVIGVRYKNADNTVNYTTQFVHVIGTDGTDGYNTPISIGSSNGTTQIGAGESRPGFLGARALYNNESLYLTADGSVNIYTNCANDNATYAGPVSFSGTASATGGRINVTGLDKINANNIELNGASNNGGYIDFHFNNSTADYTTRLIESASGTLQLNGILKIVSNAMNTSSTPGILLTGTSTNFFINAVNTNITKGSAPSANTYWGLNCYGKDYDNYNKRIAMFEGGLTSGNISVAAIRAYNCTTNTNTGNCSIEAHVDASGNAYTYAPTPATSDNSTKIATTAFVKAQGYLTSPVAIANGGTGATTRLGAAKALTNENVGASPNYFVTMTTSWGKFGYSSLANAKTALGISGSDRRIKDDIDIIPENILDAWENVDWKQFKMKKDVRLLGENAKLHFGAVVQDIQSVFDDSNIDSSKYGFLYQEDYPEEERDLPSDENSEVTNGDKWYLKYEEALCIEAAYQRRKIKQLEKENEMLREELNAIKKHLNMM